MQIFQRYKHVCQHTSQVVMSFGDWVKYGPPDALIQEELAKLKDGILCTGTLFRKSSPETATVADGWTLPSTDASAAWSDLPSTDASAAGSEEPAKKRSKRAGDLETTKPLVVDANDSDSIHHLNKWWPGLYITNAEGAKNRLRLYALQPAMIVNLAPEKHSNFFSHAFHYEIVKLKDADGTTTGVVTAYLPIVLKAVSCLARGDVVVVHCNQGQSR